MRGWGGRQGAVMRGCGTRGQMQTDERPQIGVLRASIEQRFPGRSGGTLHFWGGQ